MKKEMIVCIFLVILIIIVNILTQNYTKECVSKMHEKLNLLKEESLLKEKNEEEISNKIDNVDKIWNEYQEKLAYYIEHDELEKVETQIYAINGFIEIKNYEEIIPEIEKCIFILEHIKDKNMLNIKNIF